ncbi:dUTP diphosphatase [Paenibacillus sp. NPDC101420]|uniref:dUTP diphosphatase n=1 Tax=Paenibacillus sp. NPDC101420 TaxID=3390602 RepID=UPI003D080319
MSTLTLDQMYEMQKVLDARIIKEKGLEGVDLLPNTILALQVEIGELANEWRGFKHWSKDQEPRYEKKSIAFADPGGPFEDVTYPLIEEYVDCLHFFLSISRQLEVKNIPDYQPTISHRLLTNQFIDLNNLVGNILDSENYLNPDERWGVAFFNFIELGHALGFTFEQIAKAYVAKNQVNHERQSSGY